ncbi:MAG: hypothetical protein QM571_01460 [Micrococcaceae bacterium]
MLDLEKSLKIYAQEHEQLTELTENVAERVTELIVKTNGYASFLNTASVRNTKLEKATNKILKNTPDKEKILNIAVDTKLGALEESILDFINEKFYSKRMILEGGFPTLKLIVTPKDYQATLAYFNQIYTSYRTGLDYETAFDVITGNILVELLNQLREQALLNAKPTLRDNDKALILESLEEYKLQTLSQVNLKKSVISIKELLLGG